MKFLLIVLLAVCAISAHGFIKREVENEYVKSVQGQINELAKIFADKTKETFDPKLLKENFEPFARAMNKAVMAQFSKQ